MRTVYHVATVAFLVSTAHAQEMRFTFASIPWGSSTATTRADLKAAGYVVSEPNKDGDITFFGKILGRDFGGMAFMSPTAGLAKIVIGFPSSGDDYRNTYQTVVSALNEKYGQGQERRSFDPPYEDGDGSEESAILMGNARISTQWLGVASHTGLIVDITKSGTDIIISVSYESSLWPAEFARRARVF